MQFAEDTKFIMAYYHDPDTIKNFEGKQRMIKVRKQVGKG